MATNPGPSIVRVTDGGMLHAVLPSSGPCKSENARLSALLDSMQQHCEREHAQHRLCRERVERKLGEGRYTHGTTRECVC